MSKYIFILNFVLGANLCLGQIALPEHIKEDARPISIAVEKGFETKGQEDINSIGLKMDFARYHRDRFASSIETKIRWYKGLRSEIENNTISFGLGYAVRYHFQIIKRSSIFVDCGLGAAYSIDPFPTEGTHINGQYYFGFGVEPNFIKVQPVVSIRYYHSSNGSGSGPGNPAYDGIFISLGFYL